MSNNDSPAELAATLSTGLQHLAAAVEAHPELAPMLTYALRDSGLNAHGSYDADADAAAEQRLFVRAMKASGATITKHITDTMHNIVAQLGGIRIEMLAMREAVCERVVVGTETVTRTVPDPEALAAVPTVEVVEEVEQVEWRCRPILAPAADLGRKAAAT